MSLRPSSPPPLATPDEALLAEAAHGDPAKLEALRAVVRAGEPAAYAAGFLRFRGRRFAVDPRAYITDPELTHLIDLVTAEARAFEQSLGRAPMLAEFGTGAGTLAITLKLENPSWTLVGLELDADALAVARENLRLHRVAIALLESDYLAGWPADAPEPDFIFGDPPWGGETDLYTDARDAAYYHRMPAKSAYPPGGNPCAIHDGLIARVRERGWSSRLVLNYGVLSAAVVERSTGALLERCIIHPAPGLTIVSGRVV